MSDYTALLNQAQELRQASRWKEALQVYRQLWFGFRENCGPWEGWGYAQCLYKLNQYAQAEALCCEALTDWPDHPQLKSLLAWCLYQTKIKPESKQPQSLIPVLEQILNLSPVQDAYGPTLRSFFKILDLLSTDQDYEQVLYLSERIQPAQLSAESETFQDEKGRSRNLPSARLRWYAKRSEALFQTEAYAACESLCRQTLAEPSVSPDQRFWFERRLGRTLTALNKLDEAQTLYRDLLKRKQDWFLYKEWAELLAHTSRYPEAIQKAALGALAPGEPTKKLNLYLRLAEWLEQKEEFESAKDHRLLVLALRQENGWPLPPLLFQTTGQPTVIPTSRELLQKLTFFWQKQLPAPEQLKGHIQTLLPNGKAGFIQVDRKTSYYFQVRDFQGPAAQLEVGLKVGFEIKEGFDHKKQRASFQAIRIFKL